MSVALGDVALRPALQTDVEALIDVARRAWLSAFSERAPFALIQDWLLADRESGWYSLYFREVRVAACDAGVVALVQPRRDEVNGLWVHPAWQRRGLGSLLLQDSEERMRQAGHRRAWLTCSEFNPRGLAFYGARGYLETRRYRERLSCGIEEEYLVFERRLAG